MRVNIQHNQMTFDEIAEDISNEVLNDVQEEVSLSLYELKQAALHYKNTMMKYAQELKNFEQLLQHQKQLRKSNKNYESIKKYIDNKNIINAFLKSEIPKEIYKETFIFQEKLNAFLGKKVKTVLVYQDSNGEPDLYQMDSIDLLKFSYSSQGKLVGRYASSLNKNLNNTITKLANDVHVDKIGLAKLKSSYTESINRFIQSKKKKIVWWYNGEHEKPKYQALRVSSKGDINEGYAVAVLNNKEVMFHNSLNLEKNIELFMLHFVQSVDNTSGLLEGDTSVGNIEYAIKSANASTLGLKQIQNICNLVLQDDFNKDKLLEIKQKLKGKTRNKIIKIAEDKVQKILDANIKNLTK